MKWKLIFICDGIKLEYISQCLTLEEAKFEVMKPLNKLFDNVKITGAIQL